MVSYETFKRVEAEDYTKFFDSGNAQKCGEYRDNLRIFAEVRWNFRRNGLMLGFDTAEIA